MWLLLLSGWMLASAAFGALGRGRDAPGAWSAVRAPAEPPMATELRAGAARVELERSPARALRQLPGIGERRALEIARMRWEAPPGAPFELEAVHGIGPRTAALVREWLAEQERR